MTKEKFKEANTKLPIQLGVDGSESMLYHGYKFIKDADGNYDILNLTKGDYQVSIKSNPDKELLFNTLPFIYVCDLYYAHKQTSKLLRMELRSAFKDVSDRENEDKAEVRLRLRKSLKSF